MALGRMASWETNYLTRTRQWTPEGMALFGLDLAGGIGEVGGENDEFLSALHPADRHLQKIFREREDRQDSVPQSTALFVRTGKHGGCPATDWWLTAASTAKLAGSSMS
jgi:hypothetical protein